MKVKYLAHALFGVAISLLALLTFGPRLTNVTASVAAQSYDYTWTDDFDTSSLHPRWSWIREDATHWSLTDRPGFLRITTQAGTLFWSVNDQCNLLMTTAPSGDFQITTKVTIEPTQNYQHAGILVYQDDDNYLQLQRVYADGDKVEFLHEVGASTPTLVEVAESATTLYLRIEKQSSTYTGYYSLDGTAWTQVGQYTASFTALKVGIGATDDPPPPVTSYEIPADFDFFRLDANYTKVFLPLVLKNH